MLTTFARTVGITENRRGIRRLSGDANGREQHESGRDLAKHAGEMEKGFIPLPIRRWRSPEFSKVVNQSAGFRRARKSSSATSWRNISRMNLPSGRRWSAWPNGCSRSKGQLNEIKALLYQASKGSAARRRRAGRCPRTPAPKSPPRAESKNERGKTGLDLNRSRTGFNPKAACDFSAASRGFEIYRFVGPSLDRHRRTSCKSRHDESVSLPADLDEIYRVPILIVMATTIAVQSWICGRQSFHRVLLKRGYDVYMR